MTKKDFELIAKAIKGSPLARYSQAAIAYDMAEALAETYPRFNIERFLEACGVKE